MSDQPTAREYAYERQRRWLADHNDQIAERVRANCIKDSHNQSCLCGHRLAELTTEQLLTPTEELDLESYRVVLRKGVAERVRDACIDECMSVLTHYDGGELSQRVAIRACLRRIAGLDLDALLKGEPDAR